MTTPYSINNNIPSAKEFAEFIQYDLEEHDEGGYLGINTKELADKMIEFAQLHVQAALEAVFNNQETEQYKKEQPYDYPDIQHFRATKYSIFEAYPLTNIK